MLENLPRQQLALGVGERELLGEIGQDAQPLRPGVHHEVDAAQLPGKVQASIVPEGRGHDGEHAAQRGLALVHSMILNWSR